MLAPDTARVDRLSKEPRGVPMTMEVRFDLRTSDTARSRSASVTPRAKPSRFSLSRPTWPTDQLEAEAETRGPVVAMRSAGILRPTIM